MLEPAHPVLVVDRVRHVGDQLAVVIADTLAHARDAAELIEVDYAVEPAVTDGAEAVRSGAPLVWPEVPGNICYDWHLGDRAAVDAALATAARVVKLDLVNNRLVPNAMEPRAAIGDFDRATGEHTLYTTSQNPHVIRLLMGAFVLHIPEAKLRVVAPDVGGGFGSKIFHYAEEAIVTWAAAKLKRPVKWTAERVESFMSDAHGRDHATHVELGLDAQNKFVALKVSTIANMGAYLSTFATCVPTYLYGTLLAGTYTTPAVYVETKAVFTNTVPVDAYRGAGRPEATYLLERIVDLAADEVGIDPAESRCNMTAEIISRRSTSRPRPPITPGSRRGAPKPPAAASCAASASLPISRPVASPRRPWSDRWARAPGCSKPLRCGSTRPAA